MAINRREFVRRAGLTLSFTVAGSSLLLTPAQARRRSVVFGVLDAQEVSILEAVTEVLLPGSPILSITSSVFRPMTAS